MRYAALSLFLAAASAVPQQLSSTSISIAPVATQLSSLVTKVILPLDAPVAVTAGNGISSLADTLNLAAQTISLDADAVLGVTANLKVDASTDVILSTALQLVQYFSKINGVFWQAATELEKKVCAIASSITEQNVNAQKQNLIVGVNAQIQAVLKLKATLEATVKSVTALATSFTSDELAVLIFIITTLQQSVAAAIVPVVRLSNGLQAVGVTGLTGVVGSLQASASALVQTAANVQIAPA